MDDDNFNKGIDGAFEKLSNFGSKIDSMLNDAISSINETMDKISTKSGTFSDGFEKNMKNAGNVIDGNVTPKIGKLGDEVLKTSKKTDEASKLVDGAFEKLSKFGSKVGDTVTKVGVGIAGAMTGIVATSATFASGFEKNMANVGTLLDGDITPRMKELGDEVLKMAKKTGLGTDTLTGGLYQTISALGDSAESMDILSTASKGAKAGNYEVTDSVNFLSAVMKGYGDVSAESAEKASDLGFLTAKLGQTTMPELATSMGKVIPLASTMKVSQEELFGAMATLTGVTGGTAEVTTQLRGAIQGFMQPSKEMQSALESIGYQNGQTAIESLGLQGALDALKGSVNNDEIAFSSLFGSVEAKSAVLALTGAQAEDFTKKTNAMKDATGATEEAFNKQMNTFDSVKERIKTLAETAQIQLGTAFLPALTDSATALTDFLTGTITFDEFIGKLNTSFGELITKFGEMFPIVQPLIDTFKSLRDNLDDVLLVVVPLTTAFVAWKTAVSIASVIDAVTKATKGMTLATIAQEVAQKLLNITMLNNPFVLLATIIGTLIGAFIVLWNTNEDFRTYVTDAWGGLKITAGIVWDFIVKLFTIDIPNAFKATINFVKDNWDGLLLLLVNPIAGAVKLLYDNNPKFKKWADDVIDKIKEGFGNAIATGKKFIDDIGKGIADGAEKILTDAKNLGDSIVKGITGGIKSAGDTAINGVKNLSTNMIDGAKNIFKSNSPSKEFQDMGESLPDGLVVGVKGKEKKAIKAVEEMAKKTYESAKTWISDYRNDINYMASEELKMWEILLEKHQDVSKEKVEIQKNISKLKEEIAKAEFDSSKKWIEKGTFFNILSTEEQISAWERVQVRYQEGSQEREEIDRTIYTLKKQRISEIETAEKEALEAEKKRAQEQENLYKKQEEIVNKITDAEKKYNDAVKSRSDAIYNSFGLFDKLEEKQQEDKVTGKELIENLKGQVVALRDWKADLEKLSQMGISKDLYTELSAKGAQSREEIEALSRLSQKDLQEYSNLWSEKNKEAKDQSLKELQSMKTEMEKTINGYLIDLAGTVGSDALEIGKTIADNINKGIKENLKPTVTTATAKTETTTATNTVVPITQNMEQMKSTVDVGFTEFNNTIVGKFGDMVNQAIVILNTMMDNVGTTLRVRGFEVGRIFMRSLGDALIKEKAYLLSEALDVADAIVEIFKIRELAKNSIGGAYTTTNQTTNNTGNTNSINQNMYFYGVENEQTAFEAEQAIRRSTWEAYS